MKKSVFTRFFKQNLNKKSVGLLVGIINVIQNFFRVQFDNKNYLLSEKKLLLSGDNELNPGPAEISNPLPYEHLFSFVSHQKQEIRDHFTI